MNPEDRIGQLIRSNHPHAFRSGQWGRIANITTVRRRLCYEVVWNEGFFSDSTATVDQWQVHDLSAGYEFAQVIS